MAVPNDPKCPPQPEQGQKPNSYNELARLIILAGLLLFVILNFKTFITVLTTLLGILVPVLIGIVLTFVLSMPMDWFEKKIWKGDSRWKVRTRRPLGILFALLVLFGLIAIIMILVIPNSIQAVRQISEKQPVLSAGVTQWINSIDIPAIREYLIKIQLPTLNIPEILNKTGLLAGGLLRGVTGVLGGLMSTLLGLGFAIFMLVAKETLLDQIDMLMTAFMPPQPRARVKYHISVISEIFGKYIFGQVVEAIAIGSITTVAMLILGFPYATIVGPLTGLSSLIPMVGAVVGGVVGFLLILTVNPFQALLFVVFIIVLQQLDGMFLYPRIVGSSVGLPQLWTFFAVVIGGALLGFVGTFLGVPALAVIYRLMGENIRKRIEQKDQGTSSRYYILAIPKGTDPVRINEPDLVDLVDKDSDTSDFSG